MPIPVTYIFNNSEKPSRGIVFSQDPNFVDTEGYLWTQGPDSYQKNIYSGNLNQARERISSTATFQYLPQFAKYPYSKNVKDGTCVNLLQVIRIMKGNTLKGISQQIKQTQVIGDLTLKAKLKSENLPYITHAGIYIPRRNDGLVLPGFTYQLDIDKIPNPKEILDKIIVDRELNVLFATVGASGNGVKAMLFLKELMFLQETWTHEQYSKAYHQATDILSQYFNEKYNVKIDTQMKAISQPFFLFHSPDLFVHKNLRQWV
jgi:hypothetical protein